MKRWWADAGQPMPPHNPTGPTLVTTWQGTDGVTHFAPMRVGPWPAWGYRPETHDEWMARLEAGIRAAVRAALNNQEGPK